MIESMIQNEWTNCSLDDLFIHVIGGDWGQDNDFSDDEYETVSCIRGSEFRNWREDQGATAVPRKIKKSSLETRNLRSGDVLIEISGGGPDQPVGRTVLITEQVLKQLPYPAVCTNFLRLARPAKHISSSYLNYFLTKFYLSGEVIKYQGGSNNLRNLKFKEFSTITVPCPSFAEQKEIADRLDKLLAQVAATQARLARIPDIIKQFRQSVLAAAVSGRLTLNADIEFELLTINDVCNSAFDGPFGSKLKSSDYTDDGVRVIRLENIGHLDFLSDKKTYISKEKYSELKKNEILKNDVLFSSFVEQDVRVCIFDAIDNIYINKADCFCLRPDQKKINSKYLSFLLASKTSYEQIRENVQGVTRPRINLKILKSLEFNIPSIEAQNIIVRRVEQLFAYADSIEQQAKAAKERVDNLTQAILAKAFRGELTADWRAANPDLISGDNSAEALLARIQAERAQSAKKGRKST